MDGKREEKDYSLSRAYVKNTPTIKIACMLNNSQHNGFYLILEIFLSKIINIHKYVTRLSGVTNMK